MDRTGALFHSDGGDLGGGWGGGGVGVEQNATFSSITDPDMWVFKEFEIFFYRIQEGVYIFLLDQV